MLETKIARKIFNRLHAVAEGERESIECMTERLGIIEAVLLLYYYNEKALRNRRDLDEDNEWKK